MDTQQIQDIVDVNRIELGNGFKKYSQALDRHDFEGAKKISISILILARAISILTKITEPSDNANH